MTVSKRELKSFFKNLHPLDMGLVFKIYKSSNYNDIIFDKLCGKRNSYITKSSYLNDKHIKNQKNDKIRVKYLEFIKFLAENLFEMNIKDLGYLQSSELQEIFYYIKENEPLINKIYSSHKLEGLLFSVLKTHFIYILESSILSSETSEIKALIEDLWDLLLYLKVNIEDVFHNINKDELIQIFNLICYFSNLKQKITLNENIDKMIVNVLNILKFKIKNHFNILLQYSLDLTEIIDKPNQIEWINLLNSEDIVISNEDLILYFILKNYNGNYSDNLKRIMKIIRFNLLSDSAKSIYCKIQKPILNLSNLSRNKCFINNTLVNSCITEKPKIIILNNVSDNLQLPVLNKHLIIDNNLKIGGCFSYEVHIMSRSKLKFPGNFNDLVKTWRLFLGFSIKTGKKYKPFTFDLFSLLGENSNKNNDSKLFHRRSILKLPKYNCISGNMSKSNLAPAPMAYNNEKNYIQDELITQWEEIALTNNGHETLEDENRVIFAVNWKEKFILVEIRSLFSVYVEILDNFLEENGLKIQNEFVFPLISYNDEYFSAFINYHSCNLVVNERQISLKERLNLRNKERLIGSKTERKLLLDVNKKQPGAPKRVTRLRPSGSTSIVIPFSTDSLGPHLLSISSPINKRGRPRKNITSAYIKKLASINNKKEHYTSSLTKVSKKNCDKNISESTKVRGSNSLVIKNIKKKVKVNAKNCSYSYFNSFLVKFFVSSFNKLLNFFRNHLV